MGNCSKSAYVGVYKNGTGHMCWITFIRYNNGKKAVSVHSNNEIKAAIKYNILATFFQGKNATQNDLNFTMKEYREVSLELYSQLTLPSKIQKARSNQGYKKLSDASTEFVGVYKYPNRELYFAHITLNKKTLSLGYYKDKITAAQAYNIAAKKLYGIKAKLNNVESEKVDIDLIKRIYRKIGE